MTFWIRAKLLPPILVRLLARHKRGRPLTDDEIVKSVSGLSHFEVQALSWRTDWDGVSVDTMQLFLVACRCDFESRKDMKRVFGYLDRNLNFDYLRKDAQWKDRWMPKLIRWRHSVDEILPTLHPAVRHLAIRLTPLIRKQAA